MFKNITSEDIIAGVLGVGAVLLTAIGAAMLMNTKSAKTFDLGKVWEEQHLEGGSWIWHLYYEDDEYAYEVSDESYSSALNALRKLVLG